MKYMPFSNLELTQWPCCIWPPKKGQIQIEVLQKNLHFVFLQDVELLRILQLEEGFWLKH